MSTMSFARFMATFTGRAIRIVLGAVLIGTGIFLLGGGHPAWGSVLIVLGAVFLAAGSLNVCPIAAAIGAPFSGRKALATR